VRDWERNSVKHFGYGDATYLSYRESIEYRPFPLINGNSNNVTDPSASADEIWLTVFAIVAGTGAWDHVGKDVLT
jgi:hypothetical protein